MNSSICSESGDTQEKVVGPVSRMNMFIGREKI